MNPFTDLSQIKVGQKIWVDGHAYFGTRVHGWREVANAGLDCGIKDHNVVVYNIEYDDPKVIRFVCIKDCYPQKPSMSVTSVDQLKAGCKIKVKPETYSYSGAILSSDIIYTFKEFTWPPPSDTPEGNHRWWNVFLFYEGLFYWVKHTDLILVEKESENNLGDVGQATPPPIKEKEFPTNQLEYKVEDLL